MSATRRSGRVLGAAAVLTAAGLLATSCTGSDVAAPPVLGLAARLVSFDSCDQLLGWFRDEAGQRVTAYGLEGSGGPIGVAGMAEDAAGASGARSSAPTASSSAASTAGPSFSGTNVQEVGVGEPDLTVTDGARLVSVVGGTLRVVDLSGATPAVTGSIAVPGGAGQLLVEGDHALVLSSSSGPTTAMPDDTSGSGSGVGASSSAIAPSYRPGTTLTRIDLDGTPRVVGSASVDASYVDARMVDGVVRVVTRSGPEGLGFVYPTGSASSQGRSLAANRRVAAESSLDDWLPSVTVAGADGRPGDARPAVGCDAVERPEAFSGFDVVTVLGLDLRAGGVDLLPSAAVVAGAGTVYASSSMLYVTTERWPEPGSVDGGGVPGTAPTGSAMTGSASSAAGAASTGAAVDASPPAVAAPDEVAPSVAADPATPARPSGAPDADPASPAAPSASTAPSAPAAPPAVATVEPAAPVAPPVPTTVAEGSTTTTAPSPTVPPSSTPTSTPRTTSTTPSTTTAPPATTVLPTTSAPATTVAPDPGTTVLPAPEEQGPYTDVHAFSIGGRGAAEYLASGRVRGSVLDQFSLSEHDGRLRVATTVRPDWWGWRVPMTGPGTRLAVPVAPATSESFVTVLERADQALARVGEVGGLGRGEQIHSTRFVDDLAYVVTFRRTDPLYVVDLRDPARPVVAGELEIPGYSSYLQQIGEGRLLGVGQDATDQGRVTGFAESLFDVADPAAPTRLAQLVAPGAHSTAEQDHHALLWWAPTRTLVVPLEQAVPEALRPSGSGRTLPGWFAGVLVSRVADGQITETGRIQHPAPSARGDGSGPVPGSGSGAGGVAADCSTGVSCIDTPVSAPSTPIERALVAGDRMLTVSSAGVMVNDLATLAPQSWTPFSP